MRKICDTAAALKSLPAGIDREDLEQEAALAVWRAGVAAHSPLAGLIVHREWSDIVRKHFRLKVKGRGPKEVWSSGATDAVDHRTPEDIAAAREAIRRLAASREGLVALRWANGETLAVIGEELGVGESRVFQLLERARSAISKMQGE
jgi:DNA-directed RNA polymerase specialized sigma24 family protein